MLDDASVMKPFQDGYRAAARDLLRSLEQEGVGGMLRWLKNNSDNDKRVADAIAQWTPLWQGAPEPATLTVADIDVLSTALQRAIGNPGVDLTYEQIGQLFVRLAHVKKLAEDKEQS